MIAFGRSSIKNEGAAVIAEALSRLSNLSNLNLTLNRNQITH
jgi:hypothetical protein